LNNIRLIKYIINIIDYNIIIIKNIKIRINIIVIKKIIKIIINSIYNNLKNTIFIVNIIID